jgi:uncharacterized protein YdiU (UPF0061 family)
LYGASEDRHGLTLEYPLVPLEGARVVWYNARLLRSMGADYPAGGGHVAEFEQELLRLFAFRLANIEDLEDGLSTGVGFATRYFSLFNPFERGDGRVVSIGSARVRQRGGGWQSADLQLKGVGPTELVSRGTTATV